MGVVRCNEGHFYDNEKFEECPICKSGGLPEKPEQREVTFAKMPLKGSPTQGKPAERQLMEFALQNRKNDERTVGVFRTGKGMDPVVGWLVCMEGKEKGRDFRLHAGRNYVGRTIRMDIALVDDESITRENHCSIVYEPNKALTFIIKGEGELVEVNGKRLSDSVTLIGEEEIVIGRSTFIFIPFCREGRKW